jgi:hypothetical protein
VCSVCPACLIVQYVLPVSLLCMSFLFHCSVCPACLDVLYFTFLTEYHPVRLLQYYVANYLYNLPAKLHQLLTNKRQ